MKISDDDNQTFYEQAQEDVLGDKTFDQPCRYGHFDCATTDRGACSNEAISRRFDELLKGRA